MMHQTNNAALRSRARKETVAWLTKELAHVDINLFLTLTYDRTIKDDDAKQTFKELMWRLCRKSFSKSELEAGRRITCIPFLEKTVLGRPHYHVLMEMPEKYESNG
jgi:hypothetical protein